MTNHILVVDDEPDLQSVIEQIFRRAIRRGDFRFNFARNGKEALRTLAQHPEIDLVLTDINMPEMDGLTLLDAIGQLENHIKAIVVSAYGDMENIRVAMNRGAFDFLTKPIQFEDLETTIQKTIQELSEIRLAIENRQQLQDLKAELDIAHRIQSNLVRELPVRFGPFDIRGEISYSGRVGGDFWDLLPFGEHKALLIFGDSSGHGLSSALIMSAIHNSLRALIEVVQDRAQLVEHLNRVVYQSFGHKGKYATMLLLELDEHSGDLSFLRCGHECPLIGNGAGFSPLDHPGGVPMGLLPRRTLEHWHPLHLGKGEQLVLFSDGIIDGLGEEGEKLLPEVLAELGDLQDLLERQCFFSTLADRFAWKNSDDASLIQVSRRNE
jgi:sigma-B regulation protein RsbU (phosphoserine phosphatase)